MSDKCVCGNPSILGTVHRIDGPCFVYESYGHIKYEGYDIHRLLANTAKAHRLLRECAAERDHLAHGLLSVNRLAASLEEFKSTIKGTTKEDWRLFWAVHDAAWWLADYASKNEPTGFPTCIVCCIPIYDEALPTFSPKSKG